MSTIKYRDGDLFAQDDLGGIGHGCNARGQMGAGIAKSFRDRYPEMYNQYVLGCELSTINPGDCFPWNTGSGYPSIVFNLITQVDPGPNANLALITKSVMLMMKQARIWGLTTIGLPEIGCGIGGLNWPDVADILEREMRWTPDVQIVVVRYKP